MIVGSLSTVKIVEAQAGFTAWLAALVRVHAVGLCRIHSVHDRGHRRIESLALRSARRRIGNHRRLLHRILRLQVRAVLPRRIPRAVRRSADWASRCSSAAGTRRCRSWNVIPSWIWFFAKLLVLIAVFIWVRGTLPRLRMDQLMNFAWKFMLPMALINIVAAGGLAFHAAAAGLGALDRLPAPGGGALRSAGTRTVGRQECGEANVSLRGLESGTDEQRIREARLDANFANWREFPRPLT